jgi:hypothetical protein
MRLFPGKIPLIAAEITRALTEGNDIEASDPSEVQQDIEAILKEYIRVERQVEEEAKDRLNRLGRSHSEFAKMRKLVAQEKKFGIGEDSVSYIISQLIESFMHSSHVEEVFSDDPALNVRIRTVLRKHMAVDEDLDNEVRARMKNLEEGTRDWEVQYDKIREEMKRKLKLA